MTIPPRQARHALAFAASLACMGGAFAQNLSTYNPSDYNELNGSVSQPGNARAVSVPSSFETPSTPVVFSCSEPSRTNPCC